MFDGFVWAVDKGVYARARWGSCCTLRSGIGFEADQSDFTSVSFLFVLDSHLWVIRSNGRFLSSIALVLVIWLYHQRLFVSELFGIFPEWINNVMRWLCRWLCRYLCSGHVLVILVSLDLCHGIVVSVYVCLFLTFLVSNISC